MNIIFFGSTDDSVIVLNAIYELRITNYELRICCVVTQPPRPFGRDKKITPTPVETWAKDHTIPVVSFASDPNTPWLYENEATVINTLESFKADLVISASYGQKIPSKTISDAAYGGLNIHPSILPRWRGADPVPWAILCGDNQVGVTVVTLSESFDTGEIIAQKKIPILSTDKADPLRTKLFELGASELVELLHTFKGSTFKGSAQKASNTPYARKFTRADGFIPWELLQQAMSPQSPRQDSGQAGIMNNESWNHIREEHTSVKLLMDYMNHQPESDREIHLGVIMERFFRALTPWPGMWTTIPVRRNENNEHNENNEGKEKNENNENNEKNHNGNIEPDKKRLKILSCHLSPDSCLVFDSVQIEGKQPVSFKQFASAYLTTP